MFNKCAVVVDDDQPVLSLISDLAEIVGFSADVVLTDYRMPEMNGLHLAREIRKADHFISKQMALDNGVTDFLRKPFDFAALEAKLHSLLEQEKVLT